MKNITKTLIALFAILAFSCTQDEVQDRPVIVATDAPVLTAPSDGTSYILTVQNKANTAERFTWDSANFGGSVEVTYAVQIDKKGGDFSSPQVLGSVISANQVAVSVEVMNAAALALGAVPGVPTEFDIRVIATTGTSTSIVSSINGINITSYPAWDDWGIIGSATPGGWDADTDLTYSSTTKKYTFNGALSVGEYKFRKDNDWAVNYGDDGNNLTLEAGGANIPITAAGNYTIVIDFTAKTYTITKN